MATFESRPGQLAGVWASQDNYVMHISNQMVQIWKHCEFPNGHIQYLDRMESKPQRYVLVIRTPHDRAKTIDWSRAEWTVNVVGKPQLKIRGVQITGHILFGRHEGWDIMFYVDVLDVVKPEGKSNKNGIATLLTKPMPEEQTVVKPGDTVDLSRGRLEWSWESMDDCVNHNIDQTVRIYKYIIDQMARIWDHCEFPNGCVFISRSYTNRMDPKPPRYILVVRTSDSKALDIDWSKTEWTVNIVGKPQLKIRGVRIYEHIVSWGYTCWNILFYVDVLDVVKPEGEPIPDITPFSVKEKIVKSIDQELKLVLNSTYGYKKDVAVCLDEISNISWPKSNPALDYMGADIMGGNTMNEYEIEKAIRDGGYTEYQRNIIKCFLLMNGLLSNAKLEEVRNIRKDLRPSPKKVIYNGPATIVIFEDGSKTVVKLQEGETMDREKAVYAAICKRMFGSNKNRSNWLDILKPLMKSADEAWRVKSEKDALNDDIKKYSCKMEFDDYEDAAGFINLIGVLRDKYLKKGKEVIDILGYPSLTAFRKAVKAAKEMIKDGEET